MVDEGPILAVGAAVRLRSHKAEVVEAPPIPVYLEGGDGDFGNGALATPGGTIGGDARPSDVGERVGVELKERVEKSLLEAAAVF